MKIKLNTVNIIELVNGNLNSIHSFTDNEKGNKAAERLFRRLVREHNDPEGTTGVKPFSRADMDCFLDDGIYNDECGYELIISHSA